MNGYHFSLMDAGLIIFILLAMWSMYRAQKDEDVSFDIFDLVRENGRVSRIAFAFLVALVATTWVLIKVAQDGKMTDMLYAAYGTMWVVPIVAKLFTPQQVTTSTQTTSSTSTSATAPTPDAPKP